MWLRSNSLYLVLIVCGLAAAGCSTSPVSVTSSSAHRPAGEEQALMQQGEFQEAITSLEKQVTGNAGQLDKRINLAIAHRKLQQYAEAEVQLQNVLEAVPDNAIAWHQWAILKREQGQFNEAVDAYERALKIQPDYALAHRNYGILLDLYLQQPDQALPHYQQYLVQADENTDEVQRWVADLERRLNIQAGGMR